MPAGSQGAVGAEDIELLRKQFAANPAYRVAQNALATTPVDEVALDRAVVNATDHSMSHQLDDWKVTDQQKSGRCWLFAGLNLLRVGAKRKLNLADFEFSQNHLMFWDKFERANYFLEAILDTADRDRDDRTVAHLLEHVADDGGQWNMFVALVDKHGLVPKSVMPETQSSGNTARLNGTLRKVLREGAHTLRGLAAAGDTDAVRDGKRDVLAVVWRVLAIHLGTPPETFDWQWLDKDKEFHRDGVLTPREFAEKYVDVPLDEYVCLVHDPRATSPTGRTFTVEYLGNVLGGPRVTYLNVDIDVIKDAAAKTISGGEPVWFGCDVAQQFARKPGLWDADLIDYESVYGATFGLDKAARLEYHESAMTHAMLFTGVDILDGTPRRWRVENSWGDEIGQDGYFTMNDSWFDEYVFEIAARRDLLPAALQEALAAEPIVLPAWDPMGALA
ncbi:aminopeptidase C [Actinocatenispora rupis]|uniref:Aminopeptidase n=1 Tax=Actinocatenispora rupis TaxID=519421 RepID=A0A8J3NER2_9ACTN|nr:C1 family peptidase [Actinocatenispora rupis]GID12884.1 aminopeptidase [Actinocatenispora rupis]